MGLEVAIGAAIVGSVASVASGLKASSETRKASRAQNRIDSRRRQREQLAQVRQNQIAAAQGSQGAATGGTLDSSGYRGSNASIQSTTAGNIAFTNQIQGLQDYSASRLESANKAQVLGSTVGSIAGAVGSIAMAGTQNTQKPNTTS